MMRREKPSSPRTTDRPPSLGFVLIERNYRVLLQDSVVDYFVLLLCGIYAR